MGQPVYPEAMEVEDQSRVENRPMGDEEDSDVGKPDLNIEEGLFKKELTYY